jgi:hypothetical protein
MSYHVVVVVRLGGLPLESAVAVVSVLESENVRLVGLPLELDVGRSESEGRLVAPSTHSQAYPVTDQHLPGRRDDLDVDHSSYLHRNGVACVDHLLARQRVQADRLDVDDTVAESSRDDQTLVVDDCDGSVRCFVDKLRLGTTGMVQIELG